MTDKKVDESWKEQVQSEKSKAPEGTPPPPPSFLGFVSMLATQTLMLLGHLPHPETGEKAVNVDQAQATIDILEMLAEKTKGNLSREEEEGVAEILSELRMAFVHAVSGPEMK